MIPKYYLGTTQLWENNLHKITKQPRKKAKTLYSICQALNSIEDKKKDMKINKLKYDELLFLEKNLLLVKEYLVKSIFE